MGQGAEDPHANWASRLEDFEGGVDALAEELGRLTAWLPVDGAEPTPRLIRYYVAEEVLDKPERRGKEAIYGLRQIAQFLAARVLLADGWPLKKIAEDLRDRTIDELVSLVPSAAPSAADLVRSFQSASETPSPARQKPSLKKEALAASFGKRQYDAASRRTRLAMNISALSEGVAPKPEPRDALRIDLTDRITLLLDHSVLDELTEAQAEALGEAARDVLLEARRHRGLPKKPGG